MYREFDCRDPIARAPTPLPPVFDDDEEDYTCGGAVQDCKLSALATAEPVAALPENLFAGHADRERLVGRFEGIRLVDKQKGTHTSIAECYELCGLPLPEEMRSTAVVTSPKSKAPAMETSIPVSTEKPELCKTPQKAKQAVSADSPLSDCPTDLSQWSAERKVCRIAGIDRLD